MTTKIYYALFFAKPDSNPPFIVEIGLFDKTIGIKDCQNIPDAIEKIMEYCKINKVEFYEKFTLLYPIYLDMMDTEYESTMHQIAWLIKDQADKHKWNFNRIGGYTGLTTENFKEK